MPTLVDRLRVERAIWVLDTLNGDLPGRRRKAIRAELRADLRASAQDVGTVEAIRRLGDLRLLSAGYGDAEYGEEGPRPRYLKGIFWTALAEVVLMFVTMAQVFAFDAGLLAAGPGAGAYRFRALAGWGPVYETTYDDEGFTSFFLDFTPALLPFACVLLVAFLVGGRMWRALPRRRQAATGPSSQSPRA
jgi:hypothetical protein